MMEFRLLWAVQLKSCLPLSKSCYFNVLGQGKQLMQIKQFCESDLSCVMKTDKLNKVRTMYSKLILQGISLKKET